VPCMHRFITIYSVYWVKLLNTLS
jgi:hypothetical protein